MSLAAYIASSSRAATSPALRKERSGRSIVRMPRDQISAQTKSDLPVPHTKSGSTYKHFAALCGAVRQDLAGVRVPGVAIEQYRPVVDGFDPGLRSIGLPAAVYCCSLHLTPGAVMDDLQRSIARCTGPSFNLLDPV
jgi:hypothetical protein